MKRNPWLVVGTSLTILLGEFCVLYPGVIFRGEVISSAALGYGYLPWRNEVSWQNDELDRPTPLWRENQATTSPRLTLAINPILSDDTLMFIPWEESVRSSLRQQIIPLWNRSVGCGTPLLANNQSAVLSVCHSLRWLIDSPRVRTFGLLLQLAVACVGMALLLIRWGGGDGPAIFGALTWVNASVFTVWLLYPLAETTAWLPWVVLGISQVLGIGGEPNRIGKVILSLSLAAMLLAGHLPTAAQLLAAVGLGVVATIVVSKRIRYNAQRLVLPTLAGILLALPQVLPTAAFFATSSQKQARGANAPLASLHLPVKAAWSHILPRGFGSPEREGYDGPLNFNEATSATGVAALLLAFCLVFLRGDRKTLLLAGGALGAAALTYGLPLLDRLIQLVPLLRWCPSQRFAIVEQFCLVVLAAFAFHHFIHENAARARKTSQLLALTTLLALGLHPRLHGVWRGELAPTTMHDIYLVILQLAFGLGAIYFLLRGRRVVGCLLATIASLVFGIDLAQGFNPTLPQRAVPGTSPVTQKLGFLAGEGRVLTYGWVMRPNSNTLANLPSVRMYDAITSSRYAQFAATGKFAKQEGVRPYRLLAPEIVRRSATTLVVADGPVVDPAIEPVADQNLGGMWIGRVRGSHPLAGWYGAAVVARDGPHALALISDAQRPLANGTIAVEGGAGSGDDQSGELVPLKTTWKNPQHVEFSCNQANPGWVVLRESGDRGWQAKVDGAATKWTFADGVFMAIPIPPGEHHIEFAYRPMVWSIGVTLAFAGALLIMAMGVYPVVIVSYRKPRPSN